MRNSLQVFDFVSQLREAAEVYGAFENSQSHVWDSYDSGLKQDIERLSLFKVSQCYSVLIAAKESLPDELFPKVLRMIVILSFRYNVICSLNPNKLETAYSKTSKYIREQKPKCVKAIFEELKEFYPSDIHFKREFAEKTVAASNAKLARYILSEINRHYMGSKELIANPNATELNLEHILPQTPSEKWLVEFPKTDYSQYIYRLGNMTLLDSSINRKVGNTSFQDKCVNAFSKSKLEITKDIVNYPVWSPKQVEERQNKMAEAACQIWRFDY